MVGIAYVYVSTNLFFSIRRKFERGDVGGILRVKLIVINNEALGSVNCVPWGKKKARRLEDTYYSTEYTKNHCFRENRVSKPLLD